MSKLSGLLPLVLLLSGNFFGQSGALQPQASSAPQLSVLAGGPTNFSHPSALTTGLAAPLCIASDTAGNYYICSTAQNIIYKVSNSGAVTIYAGTGVHGSSGDGGAATSAQIGFPLGLAMDSSNNLFIVESATVVREVSAAGIISTLPITGDFLAPDNKGNLYYQDTSGDSPTINRYSLSAKTTTTVVAGAAANCAKATDAAGDGCPGTQITFSGVTGLAVANGVLYFSDPAAEEVRQVNVSTGVVTDFAGVDGSIGYGGSGNPATSTTLDFPESLAVDASGNVYFVEAEDSLVRVVSSGTLNTFAGSGSQPASGDGGPATSAGIDPAPAGEPVAQNGLALLPSGAVLILDVGNRRVREVSGGTITTAAGNGKFGDCGDGGSATAACLGFPADGNGGELATDAAGDVYIAEYAANLIRRVDAKTGLISTVAGSGIPFSAYGSGGPALDAYISPIAVAVTGSGDLLESEAYPNTPDVRYVDHATGTIYSVAANVDDYAAGTFYLAGDSGNSFVFPFFDQIYFGLDNSGSPAVIAGNGDAGSSGDGGPATQAELFSPYGLAFDVNGNLFVADNGNNAVREISAQTGDIQRIAGEYGSSGNPTLGSIATQTTFNSPEEVAVSNGILAIYDSTSSQIYGVNLSSGVLTSLAGTGTPGYTASGPAATSPINPASIASDNYGNFYIAEPANNVVQRVAVKPYAPFLKLTASQSSVAPGSNVTLTASLQQPQFGLYATGTVTFLVNGSAVATANVSKGSASLTASTSGVASGTYQVTATYSGDANYAAGSSSATAVTVEYPSTTTITVSPGTTIPADTAFKVTATVADGHGTPTGSLTFYVDGSPLETVTLSNGQASISGNSSSYPAGTYHVSAKYLGNATAAPSTSSTVNVTLQ